MADAPAASMAMFEMSSVVREKPGEKSGTRSAIALEIHRQIRPASMKQRAVFEFWGKFPWKIRYVRMVERL